jgi:hypothetical protein
MRRASLSAPPHLLVQAAYALDSAWQASVVGAPSVPQVYVALLPQRAVAVHSFTQFFAVAVLNSLTHCDWQPDGVFAQLGFATLAQAAAHWVETSSPAPPVVHILS